MPKKTKKHKKRDQAREIKKLKKEVKRLKRGVQNPVLQPSNTYVGKDLSVAPGLKQVTRNIAHLIFPVKHTKFTCMQCGYRVAGHWTSCPSCGKTAWKPD